jgi:tRNA (cytidine/uridine-2'-O-)-methyltransferase
MRLCVNTGNRLHLIRPLGFELDDARLRRAGLDYREYADVTVYDDLDSFLETVRPPRVFAFTQYARTLYTDTVYRDSDALLFGRESDGLPAEILDHPAVGERLRIPIATGGRSLNLANAAAIAVYEAWRQAGFSEG